MRSLFLNLSNGVAGDMFTAALIELFDNQEEIVKELNGFNIPHTSFVLNDAESYGIKGKHMAVLIHDHEEGDYHHNHTHHGRHLYEVKEIVSKFQIDENIKKHIYEIYDDIACAEAKVHETTVEEIHFHEVGNLDAIADISAVCYLIDKLNINQIVASEICVGSGKVKCAHGILDVPAPATKELLCDLPYYKSDKVNSELATPTGVAIVKHFVNEFKDIEKLENFRFGVGIGSKDFGIFTGLRVYLIEE